MRDSRFLPFRYELLVLLNSLGQSVDKTPEQPGLSDASDNLNSWQRIPDVDANWEFTSVTRGYNNAPNPVPEFSNTASVIVVLAITLIALRMVSNSTTPCGTAKAHTRSGVRL